MEYKENYERLPDSELLVMQIIWQSKKAIGTGKIVELVCEQKNWSRSTVQVLLARLEERGFVEIKKRGRLNYYVPLIKEEEYLTKETKTFLGQFYGNSYKKLIASLAQNQEITEEDIDDIIQIIKEAKGGEEVE
ncbi:transcriptional regulator [Anaerocolumna cellulosilytica]|uniref:Transcriptional regulator n=1 Tax=Anaerocolumna cellulosilytica TaxID=433286 RepID=A0A6S6QRE7_9FIRM|nr:BlaI/MecI/CopY family transcriptional regulator [Anaerocolumna cellulosilytica]MBB5197873.1 putative transcriptional regulator [Anaerocolumna cellulosilytica]BCJ93184.1 transcriptional regulator [Anaerocolumna cellulosilytica]